MTIFSTMADRDPDLFINSGDSVYSDRPVPETITFPDGRVWRNVTTEAKSKVAETLPEFRGQFAYNLLDHNYRRFAARVSQLVQWDDHEVFNNWWPGQILDGPQAEPYTERRVDVLAARALQAFHEWMPLDQLRAVDGRVYRRIPYGPLLEVFVLDMRTYRSPNERTIEPYEPILVTAKPAGSLIRSALPARPGRSSRPTSRSDRSSRTATKPCQTASPGPPTAARPRSRRF
jgi:alkaline phosphatase D